MYYFIKFGSFSSYNLYLKSNIFSKYTQKYIEKVFFFLSVNFPTIQYFFLTLLLHIY